MKVVISSEGPRLMGREWKFLMVDSLLDGEENETYAECQNFDARFLGRDRPIGLDPPRGVRFVHGISVDRLQFSLYEALPGQVGPE